MVGLTTVAAYLVGTHTLRLERRKLGPASAEALELVGLAIVFLAANLVAGICLILGARALSGRFLSVYWVNDSTLGLLSILQAVVFQCWRRGAK